MHQHERLVVGQPGRAHRGHVGLGGAPRDVGRHRRALGDDGPGAAAGLDDPLGLELAERARHRARGEPEVGGERADGRQPVAGDQPTGGDVRDDLRADLLERGDAGGEVDLELRGHAATCAAASGAVRRSPWRRRRARGAPGDDRDRRSTTASASAASRRRRRPRRHRAAEGDAVDRAALASCAARWPRRRGSRRASTPRTSWTPPSTRRAEVRRSARSSLGGGVAHRGPARDEHAGRRRIRASRTATRERERAP